MGPYVWGGPEPTLRSFGVEDEQPTGSKVKIFEEEKQPS